MQVTIGESIPGTRPFNVCYTNTASSVCIVYLTLGGVTWGLQSKQILYGIDAAKSLE